MKKIVSLILAVGSTLFLFVGASQAAERLDRVSSKSSEISGAIMEIEIPTLPCGSNDN